METKVEITRPPLLVWEVVDGAVQTCGIFSSYERAERWANEQKEKGHAYSACRTPTVVDHPEA